MPVESTTHITTRLPAGVEVAAYYVAAEALTNATKHANASLVRIKAANPDGRLKLSVTDNGVGGADPAQGSGLTGLTDRIEALGGRIVACHGSWDHPAASKGTTRRVVPGSS